ncbi:hypothetical protein ACFFQF_08080 [Haladaptatus pallidirubidus]
MVRRETDPSDSTPVQHRAGSRHPVVRNDALDEMHFPTWGFVPH